MTANETRLHGLMGLCVRAGQAVFGEDGCLKTIRGGKCAVLLLDESASAATADKYASACTHVGVRLIRIPDGMLYSATGRPGVAMAVTKGGLAEQLLKLCSDNEAMNIEGSKSAGKNSGGATIEWQK